MVEVTIPAGTLGLFADSITKFLFLDSYKVSHDKHLKRFSAGQTFQDIGIFFEFDIFLECNYISNSTVPMSFIIIKNKSKKLFKKVDLFVEADADYVKFQDYTRLVDLGETPLIIYLPKIPLKEVKFTNDNKINTPYSRVKVKLEIFDESLTESEAISESRAITPSYTEFLNSRWDKKWGAVWNLDYIESSKRDLKNLIKYHLISKHRSFIFYNAKNKITQIIRLPVLLFGSLLFKVLSYPRFISIIFWVPIFFRLKKLSPKSTI